MSLKVKYIIYVTLIHALILALLYYLIHEKWIFILSQLPLFISYYVSIRFFYLFDRPYRHVIDGVKSLTSNENGVMFRKTGDKDLDKLITLYNTMVTNISEERYRLEGQGQFLEDLIRVSPIGIIILDFDGNVTEINPLAQKYLQLPKDNGKEIILPKTLLEDIHEGKSDIITLKSNKRFRVLKNQVRYKGFYRTFIMIEDLTVELLQSEKEAYGKVIRMMAHEVNNSTGAVNSILQSVHEYLNEQNTDAIWSEAVLVAIDRNKNLGQFLDNFAKVIRLHPPHVQSVQLSDLCENVIKLWQFKTSHRNIKLVLTICENTQKILVDPIQIDQVLHNIIKNSLEAIEDQGEIHIHIQNNGKSLLITDTGTGITEETASNLNQPFFSTKPNGQGIGLMLSREILTAHGANYKLWSEDGLTNFLIEF
jgi:two-component system, NtrC family, nitrogen regulation sensor histidine kinase NtrY